jgi:hypothetical protein
MLAVALAMTACAREDPLAGELACQQRMVEIPSRILAAPGAHRGKAVVALYQRISRNYAAMSLDGCTDDQSGQAKRLARITNDIAVDAASLPDPKSAEGNSLRADGRFVLFRSRLEGFEERRIAMQQDLERMRSVRLR